MDLKTINIASQSYIKNLVQKQKYYGINDHDLGQAKKWIESFTHYLLYLENEGIVAYETKIQEKI